MSPTAVPRRLRAGAQLTPPPEPVELKRAIRARAEQEPRRATAELVADAGVAAHLWAAWEAELERAGVERDTFQAILGDHRRELWYWVWGNRPWDHCAQGLAGRLARRAPPGG